MTRLTEFKLTAAMDRKTFKKVERTLPGSHCFIYCNECRCAYEPLELAPAVTLHTDDANGTASAAVVISVNIEKLSEEMNMAELMEPTLESAKTIIGIIRKKYNGVLSNVLPFDRFYLSGLTYTSWIGFPDGELAAEYIRLLNQSILIHDDCKCGGLQTDSCETERDMFSEYQLAEGCSLKFYREKLMDTWSEESMIVIEVEEINVRSIERKLESSSSHNKPIDEQLSFFIMTYMDYTMDKLSSLFPASPYTKKDSMLQSILEAMDEAKIPQSKAQEVIELTKNLPEDANVYTWFSETNMAKNGTGSLFSHLLNNHVQFVCISDSFDKTDELPDIYTLVENGSYAPTT